MCRCYVGSVRENDWRRILGDLERSRATGDEFRAIWSDLGRLETSSGRSGAIWGDWRELLTSMRAREPWLGVLVTGRPTQREQFQNPSRSAGRARCSPYHARALARSSRTAQGPERRCGSVASASAYLAPIGGPSRSRRSFSAQETKLNVFRSVAIEFQGAKIEDRGPWGGAAVQDVVHPSGSVHC